MISDEPANVNDFRIDEDSKGSIFFRAFQQLFYAGKPPGQVFYLVFKQDEHHCWAFATLCVTAEDRVVLWPTFPEQPQITSAAGSQEPFDHLTLELANGRTHATRLTSDGQHKRFNYGWKLHRFSGSGLALWLMLAVRRDLLVDQPRQIEWQVPAKFRDSTRRVEEFKRAAATFKVRPVPLPPQRGDSDFFCTAVYIADAPEACVGLSKQHFPLKDVEQWVDGWPDGPFELSPVCHSIGKVHLLIATACPPGKLKDDVVFGLPQ